MANINSHCCPSQIYLLDNWQLWWFLKLFLRFLYRSLLYVVLSVDCFWIIYWRGEFLQANYCCWVFVAYECIRFYYSRYSSKAVLFEVVHMSNNRLSSNRSSDSILIPPLTKVVNAPVKEQPDHCPQRTKMLFCFNVQDSAWYLWSILFQKTILPKYVERIDR